MSRQSYNQVFINLAQEVLPPHLSLKDFSGVKLHPRIKPDGGWDNETTIFGLTIPDAKGKSLIVQVSESSEIAMSINDPMTTNFLREDLRTTAKMWDERAVDHEHAMTQIVKL